MDDKVAIFVIDDDRRLRNTLGDILKAKGYSPVALANGAAALNKLEEIEPAIALIDLKMEDMSGLEVMNKIKQRLPNTACILITGYASRESAIEAINLGAYSYIEKPYDVEQLMLTIRRALEKQKADQELHRLKQFHESIVQNLSEGIVVQDAEGAITFVNSAAAELFGYSPDELIGRQGAEVIVPDQWDIVEAADERRKHGEADRYELEILRKDGSHIPVLISGTPRFDGDRFIGTLAIFTDITELKQAEKALQESDERLRAIFETAQDSIFIKDRSLRYISVNQAMERLFEQPASKLIGQTDMDLFGDEGGVHVGKIDSRVLKGEIIIDEHTKPVKGFPHTFHTIKVPMRDSSGEIIGLCGIARDITQRKKIEEALRASEERFRSVAQTAADAIVLADGDAKIIFFNQAAEEVFGYGEEEILGKPLALLLPEKNIENYRKAAECPQSSGQGRILEKMVELHGSRKDGSEFPLELSVASWKGGEETFYSIIIRDVTEAKEAQKHARITDRLAAVGQLAAGIAHDFNNIMGAIILYCEIMFASKGISEENRERLTTIHQQAQRAASLTAQILDFSRRSIFEQHPMNLAVFMNETKDLLDRTLPENIQVNLRYADEDFIVNADPSRLQQVIINLSLNARDAMPMGGILSFETSRINFGPGESMPLRDMPPGEWVRVRVSDNGEGISADALPHVFEPFYTTKSPGEGSGLGLSQAYGIIKQHNGYIDIESSVDQGTTVILYLPSIASAMASEIENRKVMKVKGDGETILVVEDDEMMRKAVCEILEELNYNVLAAEDGHKALKIFNRQKAKIDLVIADLVMPKMGGEELYKIMREKSPELKMLIMSGYPPKGETIEQLDRGMCSWLQKPIDSVTLSQSIKESLQQGAS